jgi:protein MpaA
VTAQPASCEELDIGQTIQGRRIVALHLLPAPGAPPRPAALLFGAIHGDEPASAHCVEALAGELRREAPGRETWLIPALNLDGMVAGVKNNARDVDLNRNFAARNWSPAHQPGYFPGTAPESEPESQALAALIERSGATRLIALHQPFRTVNWDGSGESLARRMGELCGYGCTADLGYPTPGSFGSKYGVDRQLEVITLELPPVPGAEAWRDCRSALRFAVDLPP